MQLLHISRSASPIMASFKAANSKASARREVKIIRTSNNPSQEVKIIHTTNDLIQIAEGAKDRIREALLKVNYSVSFYDTAWVAMVPSTRSSQGPCFPECVDWIMDNQHPDGSWSLHHHPSLIKDVLLSTLACILALHRWNVGEEHVKRGLRYIGSKFSFSVDKKLLSPIGFDIIFPGMISYAIDMGLNIPVQQTKIDAVRDIREAELKRGYADNSEGWAAYLAYLAEGLHDFHNWPEVMRYQKTNGSLFNSPASTAALLTHIYDDKAYDYLHSLLLQFGNAVPTLYPQDVCSHLCLVDKLEKIGIAQHFAPEIKNILDRLYSCWMQNDEEITSDITTYAMAFRILRVNGYDVSSDGFAQYDEKHFYRTVHGRLRDVNAILELYKASQIEIIPNEKVLATVNLWSSNLLKEELCNNRTHQERKILQEVEYALKFPFYANMECLEHKSNIECCNEDNLKILKTAYNNCGMSNKDLLEVAVGDFNFRQSMYQKELEHIGSWVKENKLDRLEFARQREAFCYFSAAATVFSPEMSDARSSWAKAGVLTLVIDDFFDVGGSEEEQVNLITLVKRWDAHHEIEFCSEQVKILFFALYNTINELGAKASVLQKRNVTNHMIEIWLRMFKAMMKEAEWVREKSVPTMDEYMTNAWYSFAVEPMIIPTLYFLGLEISDDMIKGSECHNLLTQMCTCGRLLNDIQSFEREGEQGKLNSMSLYILHGRSSTTEDEARKQLEGTIKSSRRELLRLVLLNDGTSVVPRACKDLFWKMSKVLHLFYMKTDGLTSTDEMAGALSAVIYEPLKLGNLPLSMDN